MALYMVSEHLIDEQHGILVFPLIRGGLSADARPYRDWLGQLDYEPTRR
jgi:hypothetical protein